jgi:hypothetical protein
MAPERSQPFARRIALHSKTEGKMENGSVSEHIRREMAEARAALAHDARAVAWDARTLADWRHHFRAHPWLFCGGAAALGFLLVPRREQPNYAASAKRAAEKNGQAETTPSAASLATTLLGIGVTFLARQSANYLARRGLDWLTLRAAKQHEPVHQEDPYDRPI